MIVRFRVHASNKTEYGYFCYRLAASIIDSITQQLRNKSSCFQNAKIRSWQVSNPSFPADQILKTITLQNDPVLNLATLYKILYLMCLFEQLLLLLFEQLYLWFFKY